MDSRREVFTFIEEKRVLLKHEDFGFPFQSRVASEFQFETEKPVKTVLLLLSVLRALFYSK